MGLLSFLPRGAWVLVIGLGLVAIVSLMIPYDLVAGVLSFNLFFALVRAIQLLTALAIGGVVYRYRHTGENETESEWRFGE
mgnify:FL=1